MEATKAWALPDGKNKDGMLRMRLGSAISYGLTITILTGDCKGRKPKGAGLWRWNCE
jgi:hypothetical protein